MKRILWMRETHPYPALLWRSGGILMIASLVVMALGFFPTHSALAASISGSPFTSPGEHSFVVPAGVTSLQVVTIGGAGGTGGTECNCQGTGAAGGSGGQGAMVTATVAVTAGSTLWVEVGSNGGNGANDPNSGGGNTDAGGAGGTNGGGAGGTSINSYGGGGGGGGYSALRVCPLSGTGCPSNPWLVVAGGGGGGSGGGTLYNGFGGNGGTPNGANGLSGSPGTGGSQTAPGSGGPASGGYSAGFNGSGTNGGVGSNVGSGGGGGGYYGGGGGGGYSSGGGGGSSYSPSNATYTTTTNAPSVDVTYDNSAPTLQLPSTITTDATSAAGATVTYTVTATDPDNAPSDLTISCSPASGSTFAIGTSTVNCSASDPAGNTTTGSFQVVVKDVSPTLQLPSTITTNATSAAGATVNYTVTATDPIYSASQLTISCSPASGSTFAIGTTTVNCSVTDLAGTTVTGSFQVVVQGAATQTSNLITTVNSFHLAMSLQTALDAKLNAALKAINAGQTATACSDLSDFIGQVQAKIGKGITQSQANQLIAAARQGQAVLGC